MIHAIDVDGTRTAIGTSTVRCGGDDERRNGVTIHGPAGTTAIPAGPGSA